MTVATFTATRPPDPYTTLLDATRQTLTSRIRQIEDATGLSMLSVDDRTAAWLALRALGTR